MADAEQSSAGSAHCDSADRRASLCASRRRRWERDSGVVSRVILGNGAHCRGGADVPFFGMSVPMGLQPAKADENRVAHTSRRLLSRCMRPFLGALQRGTYIPPKNGGTYAPPLVFRPCALLVLKRRIHPDNKRRDVGATGGEGGRGMQGSGEEGLQSGGRGGAEAGGCWGRT